MHLKISHLLKQTDFRKRKTQEKQKCKSKPSDGEIICAM